MRKIFLIIILFMVGIVFLSFLIDNNKNENSTIFIYVDKNINHKDILVKAINDDLNINKTYKNIVFSNFNPKDIDSYIVSNGKNSIFITNRQLKSKLFSLSNIRYEKTIVAVSSLKNTISNISYDTLISMYKNDKNHGPNNKKNINEVINNDSMIDVFPYYDLTIKVKPLKVNGIFPSIYNIRRCLYPGTVKVFISTVNHKLFRQFKRLKTNNLKDDMFSIIAGGDIMLGRAVAKYINKYGIYYPFEKIRPLIRSNDIAFANLESPLTNRGVKYYPNKGIYFRADPALSQALKWCGFNVLSVANNHIFDWGIVGALDTENYLRNVGIEYSGIGKSLKDAAKPAVFNIGKTRVCVVSMCDIFPTEVKNGNKILKSYTYNRNIKKMINNLRKNYEVVIISYHTGIEYNKHPEFEKIQKMKSLIDYGADIVFGSHPHVVQDIEIYKNGLIAYSLGNLIFDQNWSEDTSRGLLVEVGFIGKKPIYFRPVFVDIIKGQANLQNSSNEHELKVVLNF